MYVRIYILLGDVPKLLTSLHSMACILSDSVQSWRTNKQRRLELSEAGVWGNPTS